ncbi:meiosis initiator protein isoform X3 [Mixophyes fleayi]|uniref:meiosis initiator protein isoform X3 n=1 Tax=Mixophyes fleayi TaxID=3061075 RepID=UPI003F4DC5C9
MLAPIVSTNPMEKHPMDIEELARTLPGGRKPEHGVQSLLLHVILYIEFLQRRIQDTQNRLFPHSSHQAFLPLWTPRCSVNVARKRGKSDPRPNKRCRLKGSAKRPEPKSGLMMRQTLVPYVSSPSSDNGDTGPWLVSVSVSPGSPQRPRIIQQSSAPQLDLSPSLLSSPADGVLRGGSPQVLFEDVQIGSWSSLDVEDPALPSTFSLDHSYQNERSVEVPRWWNHTQQPQNAVNTVGESKSQNQWPLAEINRHPQVSPTKGRVRRLMALSSSSSDDSNTQSPRRGLSARKSLTKKTCGFYQLQRLRKKCVNGFIMFCRLNRRPYLSAHPGKASTTATKDLADLWRVMSAQERRPYCIKALQFSLLNDRLVKRGSPGYPCEEVLSPKPLSVLLAEKAIHPL